MYLTKDFFEKTFPEMMKAFGQDFPGAHFSVTVTAFDREFVALSVVKTDDSAIVFYFQPLRKQKTEVLAEKDIATKQCYPMIAIPYAHIQSVNIGLPDAKHIGFKGENFSSRA